MRASNYVHPKAPKIDWTERNYNVLKPKKPQEVHPAPNKKATDKYLEMMFRRWSR